MDKKQFIGNFACSGTNVSARAVYNHTDKMVSLIFYNKDGDFKYSYKSVHDCKANIFEVSQKDYDTIVDELEKEIGHR